MKYYIIAGEPSGDLHGSNLIKALKSEDNNTDIRCWGGNKMENEGSVLVKHYKDLAFIGFLEVIKNLNTILKNIKFCKADILNYKPDVIVLIDYPGFNMRIAEWASKKGFKIVYYISPQVWAWKENRVKLLKKYVNKMIVILPFEKEFYKNKWNWDVEYVGHPLLENIDNFILENPKLKKDDKKIAILPGSRIQEILVKLPIMLEASKNFNAYKFVVAKAPGLPSEFYDKLLSGYSNVSFVNDKTYELLQTSTAALVTSGTATLETALFNVPEVICYKGNSISYSIAKRLIKIKFIGLVNLIMNKEVVKELIQNELNPTNITTELNRILLDEEKINQIKIDYKKLREMLTEKGSASQKAANIIYKIAIS
ncbi:MAG: lipid-A-disaccharide synthase [Ferruginibacter sp.]